MENDYEKPPIYLSPPHLEGLELRYIEEVLESNWIAPLGPQVDLFEKEVAEYVNVKKALAVSSGTAALHLALRLIGIQEGDIVFCSSFTFVASANPILYEKAVPVLIDSEPDTWNMSPNALYNAFQEAAENNKLPKAVIVVNLYGQSANYDKLIEICDFYNVPIIEDAAESLGATYKGIKSGAIGRYGIFSFNGNKIITTSGGGMLISNDVAGIEEARFLATQARDKAIHHEHSALGYNYRLSNVLASIGRAQLKVLDGKIKRKREIFNRYVQAFSLLPGIGFMPEASYGTSTRWLSAFTIDKKQFKSSSLDIIKHLSNHNIESRPVWKPLQLQPLYKRYKFFPHTKDFSVSEDIFQKGVCLPSGTGMNKDDQQRVVNCITNLKL